MNVSAGASLVAVMSAGALLHAGDARAMDARQAAACTYPAQVLDLSSWKLQLPTGSEGKVDEVDPGPLATFRVDPWFVPTAACDGVYFRAAVNGATTSGSKNPRSELREMQGRGSSEEAAWSPSSGRHVMVVREAITRLPTGRPHIVAAQVHGGDDDLSAFRLEGSNFYVTRGDDTHHKLITSNYQLGTPFEAKFVASEGTIKAYFNGVLQTTIPSESSTAYFKAGAYTQANCENADPCAASNYGEVVIRSIALSDAARPPAPPAPPPTAAALLKPSLAGTSRRLRPARKGRRVSVRLHCRVAGGAPPSRCRGTLSLKRSGGPKRSRTLAARSFSLPVGRTRTVRLTLRRAAWRTLARRSQRATLRASVRNPGAASASASRRVTVKRRG